MFKPSRAQAREFLFDLWEKHRAGAELTALETMALAIVLEHPEYHAYLGDRDRYLERDPDVRHGALEPIDDLRGPRALRRVGCARSPA